MHKYTYDVCLHVTVIGENAIDVREHIEYCMCLPWDHAVGHDGIEIVSSEIDAVDCVGPEAPEDTLGSSIELYSGPDSWGVDCIYLGALRNVLEHYGVSLDRKRGE